jgi:hypothetical protein
VPDWSACSPRGAVARVVATSAGRQQAAWRFGGSYLSASDQRSTSDWEAAIGPSSLDVWLPGHTDHFKNLKADAGYLLREVSRCPNRFGA